MAVYKIADIPMAFDARYKTLRTQSEAYLSKKDTPCFSIELSEKFLAQKQAQNPHLSVDECEYIWSGAQFYSELLNYNGFILHASAVVLDGAAYLFSAPSGTGKSTHTAIWQKYFGEDRARILNDDKPAIRFINGRFYAYGTPWSGKTDKNINEKAELKAIGVLSRANENSVALLETKAALYAILNQTLRPAGNSLPRLLELLEKLMETVPVYSVLCNMEPDAARVAYEGMSGVSI
ncbi:MAG: hypothetical protein Q4C12_04550 [Clostridia bacterium]|nr:hypothetical protein [Clostridia bacterium]